jgi:hypothetical protein
MAVRFYGDFTNDVGDDFRINIHDTAFSSTSTEVTVATPGFTLTYEGNNQEQYQPIIPSRLDFTLYNEGGAFDTFLNSVIPAANEARFLIEVLTNPGTIDEAPFWRGVLLTEQMQLQDEPTPSAVSFTASDDLAQLKETTYDELSDASGDDAIILRVHEMLSLTRCKSLYSDSDLYMRYADDFTPHDYTGDNYVAASSLTDVTIPGTDPVEYANCYDVLRSVAISFNARIFQAQGIWYFFPLNKYQLRSDGTDFSLKLHALAADASTYTWSAIDRINWQSAMLYTNGTTLQKLSGNTIEYSPPIKRVERTRITRLSEYLFQANTDFTSLDGSADDITFADDGRTYFAGSTHLLTLNYNMDIPSVASENNFVNFHTVRADFTIKFGDQYWTDTGWSGSAGTKKVVLGTYYKSNGFEDIGQIAVQVPELVDDEDGLDVTLNVVVLNGAGGDITSSLPTHSALFVLRIYAGDSAEAIGDEVVFGSETSIDNQVILEQVDVITGNVAVGYGTGSTSVQYYNGSFIGVGDEESWISSMDTTGYPLHRLGVREILTNTQLPHRIRQGGFYMDSAANFLWPYNLIREDSEDHVPHQLSYSANDNEIQVERFQLNRSTSNISFRANVVNTNNPRDRFAPSGSSLTNRISTAIDERFRHSTGQFYAVTLLEHDNGDTYQIDSDDSDGFVYMSTWVGAGTGTSTVYLPKVADNEGRLFRFKSDGTIAANAGYQVQPYSTDSAAGVRVDGNVAYRGQRPYDGVTILCYDGQWYVIQQKEK